MTAKYIRAGMKRFLISASIIFISCLSFFVGNSFAEDDPKILSVPMGAGSIAFSHDGRILASGSEEAPPMALKSSYFRDDPKYKYAPIFLWDVATGNKIRTLNGHSKDVVSLSFRSDDKVVASGGYGATIILWDVDKGTEIKRFLTDDLRGVYKITLSPDGKLLASKHAKDEKEIGYSDLQSKDLLIIWDVETGARLKTLKFTSLHNFFFSSDGKILVTSSSGKYGCENYEIIFWKAHNGEKIKSLSLGSCHGSRGEAVLSPDGKILATFRNYEFVLIDWSTGNIMRTLKGFHGTLKGFQFDPESMKLLISTDQNYQNIVSLFDVSTGERIRGFVIWNSPMDMVVFSDDAKLIATYGKPKGLGDPELKMGDWYSAALAKEKLAAAESERLRSEQNALMQKKKALIHKFSSKCNGPIIKFIDYLKNPYNGNEGQCAVIVAEIFQMISSNQVLSSLIGFYEYGFKRKFGDIYIEGRATSPNDIYPIKGIVKIKGMYTYLTRSGLSKTVPRVQWLEELSDQEAEWLGK